MPKQKYTYHYPEQITLCEDLLIGDHDFIAKKVSLSPSYVSNMCRGIRKMKPEVKNLIEKLIDFRKSIDEHLPEEAELEN